jgi:hypothetical protein
LAEQSLVHLVSHNKIYALTLVEVIYRETAGIGLQRETQAAWPGLSVDQLPEELREIQHVVLLYPPQGEKGPCRTASVLTKQTPPQQLLVTTLGLDRLGITPRG